MGPGDLINVDPGLYVGKHTISPEGLSDPTVLKMWNYLNFGQYEITPSLNKVAKAKGDMGEQAVILRDRLIAHLESVASAVPDTITTIGDARAAYLAQQDLAKANLSALADHQRRIAKAVKKASKDDALKDELQAMGAYYKALQLASNPESNMGHRDEAVKIFTAVSESFPDTFYGKRSKARLAIINQH